MPILLDELVICLQEVLIVYPASAQGVHNVFVICSSYRGTGDPGVPELLLALWSAGVLE